MHSNFFSSLSIFLTSSPRHKVGISYLTHTTSVKGYERATRGVGKAHLIKGPRTNLPSNWIIFICLHIARSTIFIRFPDKDVSILLLHFIQNLAHMILFGTGAGIEAPHQCENSCKLKEMTFVMFFLHYRLSQVATQTRAFVRKGETTHLLISLVSLMFSVPWKIF